MQQSGSGYAWNSTSQWSKLGGAQGQNQPTTNTQGNPGSSQSFPSNSAATNATPPQAAQGSPQNQNPSSSPATDSGNSSHTNVTNNGVVGQNNNSNTQQPPAESRREMVTRLYERILGREPDQYGMNYYLFNGQITELEIAREMYESTEHLDILGKAKDVRETVLRLDYKLKQIRDLQIQVQNLETLGENYKNLLAEKTALINELMHQGGSAPIAQSSGAPSNQIQQSHTQSASNGQQRSSQAYDDYPEDPFKDVQDPGFFGRLKGLFS